ncbi:MAG: flagellin [bacterium]
MSLRINYNLASSSAQRGLASSQDLYSRMASRLSTGLRINQAADDTAGMAVSEKLKNQVRGLNQAQRNAQDSVSMLQTAEGALTETHGILARIRELAVQSANDTLTASDRANLQAEADQLVAEVDRIASSTQFNGITLLNKNSSVSLHNSGLGLTFQIGANSGNTLGVTLSAVRSQDLGDVQTLNAAHAVTGGAKTIDVGSATAVNYNATVDTAFDVRDAINAANGNITASVKGGKLRLESSAAVGTVFASDGGNLQSTLFGSNATVNTVASSTSLEDLGVSASGTMTITATSGTITGATTLTNLGINSGDTLVLGLSKAAGTGGAAGTMTLADLGVTAGGTLTIAFADAGVSPTETRSIAVTYQTSDTLSALASRIDIAVTEAAALTASGSTGSDTLAVTVGGSAGSGAITLTGNTTAYSGGTLTINAGTILTDLADSNSGSGSLISKLNLTTITGATTGTTSASSASVNTAAFTESVTYTVGSETDLTAFAAGLQTAIQGAGAIGTSTAFDVTSATAVINGSNQLAIDVSPSSNGVTIATITGSGTNALRTLFGLGAAPASATATSAMNVAAQTETATVSYTTSDTLSTIATKIATAVTGIGRVGTSLIAGNAGAAASFNAGTSMIDITGVDTDTTLTFSSGALRTALNLAAPDTATASGTTSSSAAIVQNAYRLSSNALTGVTSISSSSSGSIDISTQTAASAAISTLDSAINQVSTARANIGAIENRLDSTSRSLAVASENTAAANSRIADADIAQSMSEMVRAQILQQAGISVLAQANQAPSLVLQLLR